MAADAAEAADAEAAAASAEADASAAAAALDEATAAALGALDELDDAVGVLPPQAVSNRLAATTTGMPAIRLSFMMFLRSEIVHRALGEALRTR